ncbi:MAG: peptidoglycan DD-metalloendopeptidase family protein [Syntrophomonadaceae bacterium]
MLQNFKIRLLVVIILVAVVSVIMQPGRTSRQAVEPVLKYIMHNRYDVGAVISKYVHIPGTNEAAGLLPVSGGQVLQPPCEIISIQRNYGWYWDKTEKKQKFSSGVILEVSPGTTVKPIVGGQVMETGAVGGQGSVLIKHAGEFYSFYGGLVQTGVEPGQAVELGDVLGASGANLYFEVRSKDGPVNPHSLFE